MKSPEAISGFIFACSARRKVQMLEKRRLGSGVGLTGSDGAEE